MNSPALDQLQARYHLSPQTLLVIGIALVFLAWGIGFIAAIFITRIAKTYKLQHTGPLRVQYQKILNAIVIHETFSTTAPPVSAFEYRLAELRNLVGNNILNEQLLIDQILEIKKNLSGNSARVLIATYENLELYKLSLGKLKRGHSWQKKALGIRELAEMNYTAGLPDILKYLEASHETLREESFMAVVRLRPDNPLFFLDTYHNPLSPWMRINIHHYLARLDTRKLPVFSRWFRNDNTDVALFSISMARQFRQAQAVSVLMDLLDSPNEKILGLTLETLAALDAYDSADKLATLQPGFWDNEKLSLRLVNCLGKIGDPSRHTSIIARFLDHPAYSVRFQAAQALKQLGPEAYLILLQAGAEKEGLDKIIRHINEPLLQ